MDFPRTSSESADSADYYRAALAQLQSHSWTLENYERQRRVRLHRGDVVTAIICLGCAILTLEPATNQWLKASSVGQFFASVQVEQSALGVRSEPQPNSLQKPVPSAGGEIKFANPHPGARITSRFAPCKKPDKSDCRIHPVTEEEKSHTGLDLSIARGAPILAAADGVVVYTVTNCRESGTPQSMDCGGGYGNFIEIQHEAGYSTLYAHLQNVYVSKGMNVVAEQAIGTEGSTGQSSGAHLHFEIRNGLEALDPLKYFPNTWKDWK